MLEENHIPFEWIEHNDLRNGYQICYPEKDEKRVCSVIEHSFSYGSQEDLLEIQGLLTADEEKCDSVLGNLSHMGAGAVCSNLKSDGKAVVIHADEDYETGLRKIGGILADGADIGCGAVLNPGTVIGKNTSVYPQTVLRGVYPEGCIVKSTDNIVKRK